VAIVGSGASGLQIAAELAATHTVTLCMGRTQPRLPQRLLGRDIWFWLERTPNVPADTWLGRRLARNEPVVGDGPRALARRGVTLAARVTGADESALHLADGARLPVTTVVWATGHRHALGWVDLPVCDPHGAPQHHDGVSPVPGLYFLGLRWMRSRGSSLLGWVGEDAAYIAGQLRMRALARPVRRGTPGRRGTE
jgi:putative flavoprotein involved in K+ transport